MSVLEVEKVQSEEVAEKDIVEAGQVRASHDGDVVLIVNGTKHECLMKSGYTGEEDEFLIIFLKTNSTGYTYATDNLRGMSSEKYVLREFPILLDAKLTYKEAK